MNFISSHTSKLRNQWICEKSEYDKTKENLKKCTINFKFSSIENIPNNFSKEYDKILLSNIADYLHISPINFDKFVKNGLSPMLNVNGEILAAYIYIILLIMANVEVFILKTATIVTIMFLKMIIKYLK